MDGRNTPVPHLKTVCFSKLMLLAFLFSKPFCAFAPLCVPGCQLGAGVVEGRAWGATTIGNQASKRSQFTPEKKMDTEGK